MKLRGFNNQAWVTCATNDGEVEGSIVLVQSLKRVLSNREVVIMVSEKVSKDLRTLVYREFDFVFILDEGLNTANLKPNDFGKLFALTLKSFNKCCYVSPNMMFLKNADTIFETFGELPFGCIENDPTLSIFIFDPSMESYNVLMKALGSRNGTPVANYIQNWFRNQHPHQSLEAKNVSQLYLGSELNRKISLPKSKGTNHQHEIPVTDACVVNFLDHPSKFGEFELKKLGLVELHAIKIWRNLYDEFVANQATHLDGPTVMTSKMDEYMREPIAIIGMSCRYPSSANIDEFWTRIFNGEDMTSNPPDFRWIPEQCARNRPESRKTNAGFLNVPVDSFDAKFFNISPKEALFMDPQHRLLHEVVYEALEDAGIDTSSLYGSKSSIYMGSWTNDYKDVLNHAGDNEFYRTYMGNSIGAAAARLSFLLGLTGAPSLASESGCSSAMVAVHLACESLLLGKTNLSISCGVNLLLHPMINEDMPMMISPGGHCRTFDASADGFARAEGCGVLVLKRLSDAVRDGDRIWALIRGSALSQEGISKSMGTPTVHCESLAMSLALKDANVKPSDVSYVEAHGTGTIVGDPLEIAAIEKAYGCEKRKEPLIIASVKTNVGHTESCSGITGIMKVVLAMQHDTLPAHINFESLNPAIDLSKIPARIPLVREPWSKVNAKPRIAGVSSFGITGTDGHVIIQEPFDISSTKIVSQQSRPLHLLKLSAKTEEALNILLDNYAEKLEKGSEELGDICFTANTGRANFPYRAVVIGNSKEDMAIKLRERDVLKHELVVEDIARKPTTCFLFTGQGSQYLGMGKELYETSPVFRMHFDFCDDILESTYGISLKSVLWENSKELSRTLYSQTSIFVVEYCLLKLWESYGVMPDFVLGHSLGEYAAAVGAGILEVHDALRLVAERSRLIDNLAPGKMLVIKADKNLVEKAMQDFSDGDSHKIFDYAAINSNEQTVVAGDTEVVMEFSEYLSKIKSIKSIVLDASHAFHSKHMDPMLEEYRNVAKTVFRGESSKCVYISGMTGTIMEGHNIDADYWVQHTRQAVNFLDASKTAVELGCDIFLEVGPQPVLSALTMINCDGMSNVSCLPSLKKTEKEWDTLLHTLAKLYLKGVNINWKGFDDLYDRKKVRLPHYPFIGKKFWPDMTATIGSTIHPLLGSIIPNASSTKLFQNGLNLRSLEYVKDHVIGQTAVFPGAGYLEMSLAAGLAAVECSTDTMAKPTRPMKVENLKIAAPLALEESKTSQVQIVVDFNTSTGKQTLGNINDDWNDLSVKIFRRLDSKWLTHASASFTPLPSAEEIKSVRFDKEHFNKLLSLPSNDQMMTNVYEKLASVGLKFGPIFQSLEKIWKDGDHGMLAKVKLIPKCGNAQQYIIHPAILDAMIQAVMIHKHSDKIKKKLYVPISISKFLWLSSPQGQEFYVYARENTPEGKSNEAILVDEMGTVIASMSGIELIDTTVKAVESVLEQQTSHMPDLWEESWRAKQGPMQNRISDELISKNIYNEEFFDYMKQQYNSPLEETETMLKTLEEYVYLWILNCFYGCGWKPKLSEKFTTEELLAQLEINESYRQYVNYFIEILQEEGIVKKNGDKWETIAMPLGNDETEKKLQQSVYKDCVKQFESTKLLQNVGQNLVGLFKRNQSPLQILFPENDTSGSASGFYNDYTNVFNIGDCVRSFEQQRLSKWVESGENFTLRILEVGGGTGLFTNWLLPILEEKKIQFEYTFTDISPAFFSVAEKRFEKYADPLKFKKLNIEEDPVSQGFCPGYYDYVIASDVIHATKDICQSLKNCRILLRSGGNIDVLEQISKSRVITFVFGLMDGFWRFEDFRKSLNHCTVNSDSWKESLKQAGFEQTLVFPSFNGRHGLITSWVSDDFISMPSNAPTWLIFCRENCKLSGYLQHEINVAERATILIQPGKKFEEVSPSKFTIRSDAKDDYDKLFQRLKGNKLEGIVYLWALDETKTNQNEILQPFFNLSQTVFDLKLKVPPRICAVTHAPVGEDLPIPCSSTLYGFIKSMKNESGFNCRCIGISNYNTDLKQMREVYHEIFSDDKEPQVIFSNNFRHVARFQAVKVTEQYLTIPSNRFQLILPATKTFSDLSFGPMDPFELEKDEIEVQVMATALNFRDVFAVLKPNKYFEQLNSVGLDFAGVVSKVGQNVRKWNSGDLVFGVNMNGSSALPSHIQIKEDDVVKVPDSMTLNEAATLPAVFATAFHCLTTVANVTKDDVVLIHTASGGVGLAAIQILQNIGAKIIATAGNKRKRNYLRTLGIEHVFNSRDTTYLEKILEVTNGKGVNVVLNSLTGEGFKETSLKACAINARFVEISKLSIWQPEEVQKLRPDVMYTIEDLSAATSEEWRLLMSTLDAKIMEKSINPLPLMRFDALHIREALSYLQKAKHIGKVVVVMPQLRMENGQYLPFTPIFSERSTYLITGGLGGIGFEVAKWMVKNGAKNIMLASRSPPKSPVKAIIDQLNSEGANLIPVSLDVGNYEQCKALILKIGNEKEGMNLPPLRGIMHAAGTLSDGLIINQEWPKFSSTFNAKVAGTLNLHELTKRYNLEHFVLFSSITALFGTPGQSNHSAGNNFQDAFAHYRHSIGLCATTVNWGQWGEIGVATEVDLPGMKALSTLQGISALEYVMKTQRVQTCAMNMESFVLFSKLSPQTAVYLDERIWKAGSSSASSMTIKSDEFWQQYDSKEESIEKIEIIKRQLKDILRKILKFDNDEPIEDDGNFQEMGVDSLMFVEIKNAVQALLGDRVKVTASALRDCNSTRLLSEQLLKVIEGDDTAEEGDKPPTFEEVSALIREDCKLPENISAIGRSYKKVNEIESVLLTGVTGTLGPYVLKELTQMPQIHQVYCLIRPTKSFSIEERLKKVLESRMLHDKIDMKKVHCLTGNVSRSNLGMEDKDWKELSNKVDAVFHCAVRADHNQYYKKRNESSTLEDVRSVNVDGTKNILEFTCEGQVKRLYVASTLVSVSTTEEDGTLSESWPNVGDLDGITKFAYPISKLVGELLLKTAVLERGVPAKVFRLPLISGDSLTGNFILEKNHLMLRYLFVMKSGLIPSNPFPMVVLPVDTCAAVSVKIFFNEEVASNFEIYNITHPSPDLDQEFTFLSEKLGYPLDIVELDEFTQKILNEPDNSSFALFKEFYKNDTFGVIVMNTSLLKWLEGVENFWLSKKIVAIYPEFYEGLSRTVESLERDLMYAKKQGWFQKLGLSR